ncbi:hypothetical protein TPA0909_33600 [Streptomyces albus]|nr:hypothetical protein TPA0909_33600 [Streptomyces albus]
MGRSYPASRPRATELQPLAVGGRRPVVQSSPSAQFTGHGPSRLVHSPQPRRAPSLSPPGAGVGAAVGTAHRPRPPGAQLFVPVRAPPGRSGRSGRQPVIR